MFYQFPLDSVVSTGHTLEKLNKGTLSYAQIPEIAEQFFAVTQQRHFNVGILDELLTAQPS